MKSHKTIEKPCQGFLSKNSSYNDSKVKFRWNDQSIKWYLSSEKTTTFYKRSMEILQPHIQDSNSVLDIGCGIGGFSMEFAQKGLCVTAIDKSEIAIKLLSERIKHSKLSNIEALNISFEDFKFDKKYDLIFISYMMGLINSKNIERILKYSNKHLILLLPISKIKNDFSINNLYKELGIDSSNLEQSNYLKVISALDKKNISYKLIKYESDFGQPFETIEEAIFFIYNYFNIPKKDSSKVKAWLEQKLIIKDNIYYLPNIKESAMIVI